MPVISTEHAGSGVYTISAEIGFSLASLAPNYYGDYQPNIPSAGNKPVTVLLELPCGIIESYPWHVLASRSCKPVKNLSFTPSWKVFTVNAFCLRRGIDTCSNVDSPQILPCAWAHFQSRTLLHTSLAPPAIIQPAGASVSYGLRAGCACPPTCVGGSQ